MKRVPRSDHAILAAMEARWAVLIGIALSVASACGGKTSDAAREAGICERGPDASCAELAAGFTVEDCEAELRRQRESAKRAGCSREYGALLDCQLEHPITCDGTGFRLPPECDGASGAVADCIAASGDRCAFAGSDPCSQCVCAECPCDAECVTASQEFLECFTACQDPTCFADCLTNAPPEAQALFDCTAARCADACAAGVPMP